MPLKSGSIVEGYEIIETIGNGAMSTVYLGKKDNSYFAIKELISEISSTEERKLLINVFHREADILFNMFHPGIPRFYKNFTINEKSYIVMEYIKGINLEDIIKNSTLPFDEQKALNWAIQICEILCYLHNLSPEPVIYRDLKPSNIIITEGDIVRVIDFGVARRYDPSKDCDTVRLGTPGYAAPEQCRNKGQSIPQSDIYALGVVLHQLLTLYDPSVTPFKLPLVRKLNSVISEQLEWIINKAINPDPKARYIDTGLFRDELLDYYEEYFTPFTSPYSEQLPYIKEKHSLNLTFPGWSSFFLKFQPSLSFSPHLIYLYDQIDTTCDQILTLFRQMYILTKVSIIWIFFSILLIFFEYLAGIGTTLPDG